MSISWNIYRAIAQNSVSCCHRSEAHHNINTDWFEYLFFFIAFCSRERMKRSSRERLVNLFVWSRSLSLCPSCSGRVSCRGRINDFRICLHILFCYFLFIHTKNTTANNLNNNFVENVVRRCGWGDGGTHIHRTGRFHCSIFSLKTQARHRDDSYCARWW